MLPTDAPGKHYQGDVTDILGDGWDMMIAFPPCTHLAVSGARWFKEKRADGRQQAALDFVRLLMDASIDKIAIENPVSIISSHIRKPDQTIQPWQYGHGETKRTCLWLKGLPLLTPTDIVEGREQRIWKMPPSPDRWKLRSQTFQGIADAMAGQWS
jgi:site-specific DNA-cytosine methylase